MIRKLVLAAAVLPIGTAFAQTATRPSPPPSVQQILDDAQAMDTAWKHLQKAVGENMNEGARTAAELAAARGQLDWVWKNLGEPAYAAPAPAAAAETPPK